MATLLKSHTVFVVGAGASAEFGLPVGSTLALEISGKLNVRADEWGRKLISGDADLFENVVGTHNEERQAYQHAAWQIRDGIILANSIDDFLDVHRHDHRIVEYGKAAIVKCILEAERRSKLFFDRNSARSASTDATINFGACADTWLVKLMRLLGRGLPHANRAQIFEKCSFVIFNYDRCIEHFFIHALQRLYKIDQQEAIAILSTANIFHAYGSTGELDGIVGTGGRAPFGAERADYRRIGETTIKTYTESVESDQIRNCIDRAQHIVFLGFAYHDQNLALLSQDEEIGEKSILGTAFRRSENDIRVIQQQMAQWIRPNSRLLDNRNIELRELTASEMFDYYSKTL